METAAFFAALAALWLPVFYRLSFFWETDDQYSHGWFVPLLAAWVFYTRWQTLPTLNSSPATRHASPVTLYPLLFTALLLLAGAYFISEANPDWRLMMWIMAGSAFLGSLLLTQIFGGTTWTKHLCFAFFFALVSVPWPFGPEKWLTLELSMLGARLSASVLTLLGIPAVCVGNTIEVSVGTLGVDEACSGIRSFQSSLMAGLFLGELYMLRLAPRVVLCLAGLIVAYGLNVARMLILSIAVETSGSMDAISQWHDPAGFVILLATMAALWGLCALAAKFPPLTTEYRSTDLPKHRKTETPQPSAAPATRHALLITASVLAATLFMAISTEGWFRYQESRKLVKLPDWGIAPPPEGGVIEDKQLPDYVKELLGQDIGLERSWTEGDGRQWHLIFLRWLPGNMRGDGGPHAPDTCQTAVGRTITAKSDERRTEVHGIPLPYYIYTISGGGQSFHLMYVVNDESFAGERVGGIDLFEETHRHERIHRALMGKRRTGNRSMQLALVGESDAATAERAMLEILPTLIKRND